MNGLGECIIEVSSDKGLLNAIGIGTEEKNILNQLSMGTNPDILSNNLDNFRPYVVSVSDNNLGRCLGINLRPRYTGFFVEPKIQDAYKCFSPRPCKEAFIWNDGDTYCGHHTR